MNDNNGVTNYSYYANGKLKTIKYPDSKILIMSILIKI